MHLDSDQLTLHFPTEEHPRQLRCGIVKGDTEVPQVASEQEMNDLFGPDAAAPHVECNEDEEEENNEGAHDDDDDDECIEKEALGGDEALDHDADKFSENSLPPADGGSDDDLQHGLEDLIAGEHADKFDVWTVEINGEDTKAESSANGADGDQSMQHDHSGLYTTEQKEKLLLPFVEGVKLQHRGTFDASKTSPGFQVWYGKESKWFSYGVGKKAKHDSKKDAYEAALNWVWAKHADVVGYEAASTCRAKNLAKYGGTNTPS